MNVNIEFAQKVLENYCLGTVIDIQLLASGYANENYKLTTNNGNVLFRIYREKKLKEIQYELSILDILKKYDFPAAYPYKKNDTEYINSTSLGQVVLYDFIEGSEPNINQATVGEIAHAVATLHNISSWKDHQKKSTFSIQGCENIIDQFSTCNNQYPEIFGYFKEKTEFLSNFLAQPLPQGFVHGDIFPDNTIFKGDQLVAILDFEEICTDSVLFDVGVIINGFCFIDNRLSNELLVTFLSEYNKVRKLSNEEIHLLPYYIQWGAHAHLSWHLAGIMQNKNQKKQQRINELIDRLKSLEKYPF